MTKAEVIRTLELMATYLELDGAGPFEVMAFRNGAMNLDDWEGDLDAAVEAGTLTEIDGVGKGLARFITELHRDGRATDLERLRSLYPESLLDLLKVPGVGPKKVKVFFEELGIDGLDALEKAAREERIRPLKGMGAKTEERILAGIERARERIRRS